MEVNEDMVKGWLDQINEWASLGITEQCILQMTDALEELKIFLAELEKVLTKLEPREILSQFPSVPKLLHGLLNNVMVQSTEDLHHLVMHCVTAVAVSSQQQKDGINEKSVGWVKSQIKTLGTSYPDMVSSNTSLACQLGLQPVDIMGQFNNELVSSLAKDLRDTVRAREWSELHRNFIPKYPIKGTTLRNISEMCLPILAKPVVRPLIEALLCCEVATDVISNSCSNSRHIITEQALSPHFLSALKGNPRDYYLGSSQGIQLSYDAIVGLWMKDHLFFEEEIMSLLEICCFERKYMSRKEMKKIISLRQLPKALSENTSLFSITYDILQRVICETSGNFYVIKLVGVLFQLLSEAQRQKNKTQLADTYNVNFANIWCFQLANFVNLLAVDWADMPTNSFLHHVKRIEHCINEMCDKGTSSRYQPYYIWLILQGFPDLAHRCFWSVLFASEQFVEICLPILLWCYGGGIAFGNNFKIKMRLFVDTLRHLRNKSQVTTSDILCALDSVMDVIDSQPNVVILTRYLVMLFVLNSCSVNEKDFHQFVVKTQPHVPDAFDQMLDIVEETVRFKSEWIGVRLNTFSENSVKLLNIVHTRFEEYDSQLSQRSRQNENADIFPSMFNDLRSRFETLCKLLRKES